MVKSNVTKFVALFDLHFGYERKSGHKTPLHDVRALDIALRFVEDFKPDTLILGGDILDCGAISHHNKGKPGRTEGLRLLADAQECAEQVISPLNELGVKKKVYLIGNHEDWLTDLEEELPGLEGMVKIQRLLPLDGWEVIPSEGWYNLGKLTFRHGHNLKGGDHIAKAAVIDAERSIRFGHFHTYQAYTKTSSLNLKLGRTGMAVPCLCSRDPKYGEGKANRWVQGLNYGYIMPDGSFHDYVAIIVNGRTIINGKEYRA